MNQFSPAAACLLLLLTAVQARAQAPDFEEADNGRTLRWRVWAGLEHDSNVLRAPQAVSDEVGVLAAGVRLDKRYSLQRLTLDAEAAAYRFRDRSGLDYATLNYTAAWNFQFTPRLLGLLSAERRQYRDITTSAAGDGDIDRRTERREVLEATYSPAGGWRTLGALERSGSRSDEPRSLEASASVASVRVGGGYDFPSGAMLTAQLRRGEGDYGTAVAGPDFSETEPSVSFKWPVTARSVLDLRVGHLQREHDDASARDFRGLIGSGGLRWEFSPKTRLEAGLARDLGSYEFSGGGQIRGWRLFLAPVWKPTEKTAVRLRHARETRQWRVLAPDSPDLGREDRTRWNTLTLEWEPRRWVLLTASARHERRNSSLASQDFRATVYGLMARLNF